MKLTMHYEGKTLSDITAQMLADVATLEGAKPKKAKPESTVSDEESEDFGKKSLKKKDVKAKDEDDEDESTEDDEDADSDEDTSDDEDESDEDDAEGLGWDEVKAAINKYGEKKPDDMKAILLGFNMKSTKELKLHQKKWEAVYRKVMAKIKAAKKAK